MNYLMLSAAALMGLTTGVHLFAGTDDIMTPILQAETIDPVIRAVALVVWHMVTLILLMTTLALIYLAKLNVPALAIFLIVLNLGFAAIFLAANISMFNALFTMPQWIAFVLVPALMILGRRKVA